MFYLFSRGYFKNGGISASYKRDNPSKLGVCFVLFPTVSGITMDILRNMLTAFWIILPNQGKHVLWQHQPNQYGPVWLLSRMGFPKGLSKLESFWLTALRICPFTLKQASFTNSAPWVSTWSVEAFRDQSNMSSDSRCLWKFTLEGSSILTTHIRQNYPSKQIFLGWFTGIPKPSKKNARVSSFIETSQCKRKHGTLRWSAWQQTMSFFWCFLEPAGLSL